MNDFDERDLLTRELRDRSQDIGGHPLGLDHVRTRARRIQRRRNAVAGTVAAVVLAVAVPTALSVTDATRSSAPPPADQPTPSVTETPTPGPDGTFPLTIKDLPRGAEPGVSYVLNAEKTLVTPDGPVDLPEAYSQITPYLDGWLALAGGENGFDNVFLDADMDVERTTLGGAGIVPNADGTRVLYSERDFNVAGRTVVVDAPSEPGYEREPVSWDAPRGSTVAPVGFAGEDTVAFSTEDGELFLGVDDADPHTVPLQGFLGISAASEANGLVAGMVSYDDLEGAGCYGVLDPAVSTTETVWDTCDHALFEFSPDGRFVIAGPPQFDGYGPSGLAVLDAASGDPLVEFSPTAKRTVTAVSKAVWEDSDTVLALVVEGNETRMVRAELDGRLEAVTDTYPIGMNLPLWFADRPRS